MHKALMLLACVVSFVAAGVLDHRRTWVDAGLQQGDTDRIMRMSRQELLRQKFLLDVLHHVHQPLLNEELLQLADTLVMDQNKYNEQIDDEMLHVIELAREQRLLGKEEIFTIACEDHVRQMVGLYRLLVRAVDWDTFQRNVVHARKQVNGVLLVNALLLAVRDRQDTQMLIMPALQELLPEQYIDDETVRKARTIDMQAMSTGRETMRPGLLDMIGLGKRTHLVNEHIANEQPTLGMWGRRQLWMPWREMRMELAMHRQADERPQIMTRNENRIVLPVQTTRLDQTGERSLDLLTEDVGLKAFVHQMINDLILQEAEAQIGQHLSGIERERMDQNMQNRRRIGVIDQSGQDWRRTGGMDENEQDWRRTVGMGHIDRENAERARQTDQNSWLINNEKRWQQQTQSRRLGGLNDMPTININNERLLHVGRRHQQNDWNVQMRGDSMENMGRTDINGRRLMEDLEDPTDADIFGQRRQRQIDSNDNDDMWQTGGNNRVGGIRKTGRQGMWQQREENMVDMNQRRGGLNMHQTELPTTDINNERLLHVGRRHRENTDINWDTDRNMVRGRTMINQRQRFLNTMEGRRLMLEYDTNGERRQRQTNMNDGDLGQINNGRQRMWHNDWNDDERSIRGGKSMNIWERQQQMGRRMNTLDQLPSTSIDDERLLHVNRRRLNQQQGVERQQQWDQDINRRMGVRKQQQRWNDEDISGERSGIWGTPVRRSGMRGAIDQRGWDDEDTSLDHDWDTTTKQRGQRWQANIEDEDRVMGERQNSMRQNFWNMMHHTRMQQIDNDDHTTWRGTGQINQRNMGMHGSMDGDRMLHMTRGRVNQGTGWGTDNQDVHRMKWSTQRGMEDIGTEHDSDERDNRQRHRRTRGGMHGVVDRSTRGEQSHMDWHQRSPRSADMNDRRSMQHMRSGEILLHNLQQMLARINLERIAVGLNQIGDEMEITQRMNNPRLNGLNGATDQSWALRLNDMRLGTRRDRQILERLNEIEQRLSEQIEQIVQRAVNRVGGINHQHQPINARDQSIVDDMIGQLLIDGGQMQGTRILDMLREIIMQTERTQGKQTLAHISADISDACLQHWLHRLVRIIDQQRERLVGTSQREDLELQGVTINDVAVERLRTHIDTADTDLINLLDPRITLNQQQQQGQQKMVVGRQQRLNHKSFSIHIDLNSDRDQRVVVRTILLPKVDGNGRQLQLDEQRLNGLMLDAAIVDLRAGHNILNRKSKDITWTMRDTTPMTEIYQLVLRAINGEGGVSGMDLGMTHISGQSCRFPHNLLLPRGRVDGLPMQLMVIVTPMIDIDRTMQQIDIHNNQQMCGIGIGSHNLDHLPLGFPLDRKIEDSQQLLDLSNVMLKDVRIYHEDHMHMSI